jgi:hypothetical protein
MGIVCASEGSASIAMEAVAYGREDRCGLRLMRRMEVITFEGGCNRGGILNFESTGAVQLTWKC